jgi:hypothetical protein
MKFAAGTPSYRGILIASPRSMANRAVCTLWIWLNLHPTSDANPGQVRLSYRGLGSPPRRIVSWPREVL